MLGFDRRARALTIVALSLVAGCGSAKPPANRHDAPVAEPAAAPSADVVFATDAGRPFPWPLLHGSIAGRRTLMVVDTGSAFPVIATWLAREAGLELARVPEGTHDPSGRPVAMDRCDRPRMVIDGLGAIADRPTAVIDLPDAFQKAGVGAIVSPQALVTEGGTIVLDLRRGTMRRAAVDEPLPGPPASPGAFELERPVFCPWPWGAFAGNKLAAMAVIDGVSTVLEVDTGAFGAAVFVMAESDAGRKLLARPGAVREDGVSAAGPLAVTTVPDVPVQLGTHASRSNVPVMPGGVDPQCGIAGRVGIEVLRSCALVIGTRGYRARCEGARE